MKYHVVVSRDGDGWMADVPELPGTHTWAKTLRALTATSAGSSVWSRIFRAARKPP